MQLLAEGVTTLEIKSGYGLALEHERKTLQVARALGQEHAVSIRTTFLGAHALPPEFAGRADDYVAEVLRMLPLLQAEGLVNAVDAFCERIAFSPAQTARVAAMAAAGSVAVLLPGAFYFLRETRLPPVDLLRRHHVPMAISTDCNPGSSPCSSLLLMLNMACTLFRLTLEEALAGVTRHAAQALGLSDRGALAPGMRADFVLWDVQRPAQPRYGVGANPCLQTIFNGEAR